MKYNNTFYMQVSRAIFDEQHSDLSLGAKSLFFLLNELEQRYCSKETDYFYRSNEDLAQDLNISLGTLKKYKSELLNKAPDLVQSCKVFWKDKATGKRSKKHVTGYRILR